jgi:Uma2 family endonuclease
MIDAPERTRVTFDDYAAMEESNQIIELINGEIVLTATLNAHIDAFIRLIAFLIKLPLDLSGLKAAPAGLYIDDFTSLEPDIFWISPDNDRCFLRPDKRYWQGSPDLVIEILSPSTEYHDRGVKFQIYQAIGVREYWLVNVDAKFIEVYTLQDGAFGKVGVFGKSDQFDSAALKVTVKVAPLFV